MLIRRRIEKLERTSPPTIGVLVNRIEREAMSVLSRNQEKDRNGRSDGVKQSAMEGYQEALSSALEQVSDEDLDRMILWYIPKACPAESRQ